MGHRQAKETVARGKRERWHSKQRCQDKENSLKTCGYCGLHGVHPKGWACPAFGKRCYRCHKIDHFAVACRTKLYSCSDFNSHKNKHEIICRGNKTETNKLDKTVSLNSNIGPKMVGHLIVNHLKKSEEFEAVHHTEKRDIQMESLPGRGSGQDLAGQSTIRNRPRGSRLTDKEQLMYHTKHSTRVKVTHTEEDGKPLNKHEYWKYHVTEEDTRHEIKFLQKEIEQLKYDYKLLESDFMKMWTEFRN